MLHGQQLHQPGRWKGGGRWGFCGVGVAGVLRGVGILYLGKDGGRAGEKGG